MRKVLALSLLIFASGLLAAADWSDAARLNYTLHCRGCHLSDGRGAPGAVPDFSINMARYLSVEGGREYVVRVPGAANSPLTDQQLADVTNWIYANLPVGPMPEHYTPFSREEVAQYRREPLVNVLESKEELERRIRELEQGN